MEFRARGQDALEVRHGHEVMSVTAWGKDSVRVRAAQHAIPAESHGALDVAPPSSAVVGIEADGARLVNGEITVVVSDDSASEFPQPRLTFLRTSTGEELLTEQRVHFSTPPARVYRGDRAGSYAIEQHFAARDERLFGLGQRTHGRLDLKGLSLDLVHRNGEISIPFVLSDRGYGMLWNVPALGRVDFAENVTRWRADSAKEIDYWVTAAPTPAEILSRYADVTGHVPDMPTWATGFWQSKLRYRTQEELLAVAREYRRRNLPLSVIVADFFHWTAMGDYRFDPAEWPDVPGMVAELEEMGVRLMVSIWPTVSPLSEHFDEYREHGLLVGSDRGMGYQISLRDKGMPRALPLAFYDPTNPRTREFVWDLVRRNYVEHGIDVFWLDACEPELNPPEPENTVLHAGPGPQVLNIYPRENARLFAEGMASLGREPTVLLCRSAWAGSQRYGAAVWSGDVQATWESFNAQVRAGLSVSLSGMPWWTTDIGGFHGGDPDDPAYRELLVRWFQFGAFCPLFRLHGDRDPRMPTGPTMTGGPNEVWSYGDEAYAVLVRYLRLRERLRPYLQEQMSAASKTGVPPVRSLFVDFPDDARTWDVDDAFLFGPDVLVAPVLAPGRVERSVYLPAGARWVHTETGEAYDGGSEPTVPAPLASIPVFVREGAPVAEAFREDGRG